MFSGLFGAVGVIAGAVGTHLLQERLPPAEFVVFTTAITYLLLHSVALFGCGVALYSHADNRWFKLAGVFLVTGIVLFCGSLIIRSVTGSLFSAKIAPVGGSALILGWLFIAIGGFRLAGTSE
tara:strand:+ start:1698 stop:2066 length:369 start_codon:yes stop_codon:yes gene_type:complete